MCAAIDLEFRCLMNGEVGPSAASTYGRRAATLSTSLAKLV